MSDETKQGADTPENVSETGESQPVATTGSAEVDTTSQFTKIETPQVDDKQEPSEPVAGKETPPAEETDGEITKTESVDDFLEVDESEEQKKSNVQKRIDTLTAKLRAAEEKLAEVEKTSKSSDDTKEYSEEQLARATEKAIEDGDHQLLNEIMKYREGRLEKRLVKRYEDAQKQAVESAQRNAKEWEDVCANYAHLYGDAGKEIYPNSKEELNLKNHNSLLYQVTLALYQHPDSEKRKYYSQPGGQKLAAADAFAQIMKKRLGTSNVDDGEVERVKRQLAKEKKKTSLGSATATPPQTAPSRGPRSDAQVLDDVINERKKRQNEAMNALL